MGHVVADLEFLGQQTFRIGLHQKQIEVVGKLYLIGKGEAHVEFQQRIGVADAVLGIQAIRFQVTEQQAQLVNIGFLHESTAQQGLRVLYQRFHRGKRFDHQVTVLFGNQT